MSNCFLMKRGDLRGVVNTVFVSAILKYKTLLAVCNSSGRYGIWYLNHNKSEKIDFLGKTSAILVTDSLFKVPFLISFQF